MDIQSSMSSTNGSHELQQKAMNINFNSGSSIHDGMNGMNMSVANSHSVSNGSMSNNLNSDHGVSVNSTGISSMPMSLVKNSMKAPTCKVCGDESSGFHYGVDSCEGCKGFFRRCITQGMTHKCSNEEKCEITPFTRNSCQYCRLKKCFAVGMSREASRLGRRPKRLKDPSSEGRGHTGNLPIAPYPTSPQELQKMRMAELQKVLQQNGTFKAELMQAFLQAAQVSFREHQRNPSNQSQQNMSSSQKSPSDNANMTVSANGHESGYSSFSSPMSSKSQSPVTSDNLGEKPNASIGSMNNNYNEGQRHGSCNGDMALDDIENLAMSIKPEPGSSFQNCGGSGENNDFLANMDLKILSHLNEKMFLDPSVGFFENFSPPEAKLEPDSPCTSETMCASKSSPDSCTVEHGKDVLNIADSELEDLPVIDENALLEEVRQAPSDVRRTLIEQVTESVVEAHFQTCNPTYQNVAEANTRFEEKMACGDMPDFSKLVINPNSVWQQFVSQMVPEITLVVKFCKKIPGFGEIDQEDQIKLIKQGSFEVLLCRFCNLVDFKKGLMFDPEMKIKCPRHMVKMLPMGGFMDEFFNVAEMFNPQKLTDGEIGLFSSTLIICPERKGIKNYRAVKKLQSLLFQSLYALIKKNHFDYDKIFMKAVSCIKTFRVVNKKHRIALNSMQMTTGTANKEIFPPLHQEIFEHGECSTEDQTDENSPS